MGGNFREKLDMAPRIKFRGFKFHGTTGGNMTFEYVCDRCSASAAGRV